MESNNRKVVYCGERIAEVGQLQGSGWEPVFARNLDDAAALAEKSGSGVGLLRLSRTDEGYLRKVEQCLLATRATEWIALVNGGILDSGELAAFIANNFYDFHTVPIDFARLEFSIGHASGMAMLKDKNINESASAGVWSKIIVGQSSKMLKLFKAMKKVVKTDSAVLITGESGTGKELVAREIHEHSARSNGPFVAVNCGSLPEKLIQSELFGHEKGAFTGAASRKKGKIEAASGGTIFLDEIGDLPYEAQVNLLRFLQEGTIERVGGTEVSKVDVRVLAATHVDLDKAIAEGRFREDLYYRLNVLNLHIPPLRERGSDIEVLANSFFEMFAVKNGSRLKGFSNQALAVMRKHHWPGNVRELMNRVQRACVMAEGKVITPADLDLDNRCRSRTCLTLENARKSAEEKVIRDAIYQANHNIAEASRMLGVSRVTLYRLLDKHRIVHLYQRR